ncbi:MAG: hypothetical protein K9H64_11375 [Bacteroidales bacterium]|nr:hypothetical protein [Bacteroidales bacterium]MCF8456552.1 hypothetical protein [Bacteroidales bacterium]
MAFLQNSVVNKHLKSQNKELLLAAYAKFRMYFHNPEIQKNIRDAKEEQFQEGFLRELFVNVLGYTLNPQPNYNLTAELKNEKGLKKALVQLSLSEEAEWMQYFNEQKQKVQTLKAEIARVDTEIDQMVYALYGLTEEEIKIVEESTK